MSQIVYQYNYYCLKENILVGDYNNIFITAATPMSDITRT